jgi:hypothetical protein
MPIFYHLDSFLYQLVSCFDMLLQVVNIRSGVGLPVEQVMWKAGVNSGTTTRFMKLLKVNDPTTFDKIDDYYRNDLFVSLKKLRDHVAHRGAQGLSISISEECGTTAVSIAGQPYEIVERCEMWGKFVGDMILDVDPDLRKKI